MLTEDLGYLLAQDEKALNRNGISDNLLSCIDEVIFEVRNDISTEALGIYKKFLPMKQEAPDGMKNELFTALKNYIKEKFSIKEYPDAILLLRFLMVKSELSSQSYYDIAEISVKLGYKNLGLEFIKLYEKHETNKPLKLLTVANFYNLQLQDYKTAIKYYEQYIKIDETKSVVYTIIGSLYSKAYGDFSLKDQIYYYEKAYKLKPNDRLILHSLAFGYEKLGYPQKADKFYKKLLENNPTETDYYNYGAFLISCGDFINGHKYFSHRFNIDDVNLKYPLDYDIDRKWNFETNLSDKTLLVHYEQGFGDTFMYCRFIPQLKKYAKKLVFVVQDDLFDLIKNSKIISDDIEVISDKENVSSVDYDYHMALLDVPYVLATSVDSMPYSEGYLSVEDVKVEEYAKKYIKPSKNMKVGVAYQGNKNANYNGRDIDFTRFKKLFEIADVDFYSFVIDEQEAESITSLGKTFNNFTDTACALKNMDIVISTDNVILNLAGALGVKSYGLFNKFTNYRWYKLDGNNVGWYNSVVPLQVEENNCWSPVFAKLYEILK